MNRRELLLGLSATLAFSQHAWSSGKELRCDIAVIGGGTGGYAAAFAALRNGMRVILTEETDWLGGQLTAQAVPPDEHPWIEKFGSTASYRQYRQDVRNYYRANFPLTAEARSNPYLNPGNGSVSRLTHEFRVSATLLEAKLHPYIVSGKLTILYHHVPESAATHGDLVDSVTVRDLRTRNLRVIHARYFLDATELGDLLAMAGVESVTGAEAQSTTQEMSAPSRAEPTHSQGVAYCFAMDYLADEDHTIAKPAHYENWKNYSPQLIPAWTGRLLSWTSCTPTNLRPQTAEMAPNGKTSQGFTDLWSFRRIADRKNFTAGSYSSDITLVNWPQNDFWLQDLVTASPAERAKIIARARELSLSLFYWMQTEAPRPDGGAGFRGLRLRPDVTDSSDGLAKSVYVRESRRIRAEFTILQQHVDAEVRRILYKDSDRAQRAEIYPDSVGVGCYRIDLHPSVGGTNYIDRSCLPFQIPLGALLPVRVQNLLPACKNIGATHISNGCTRLHPVEWNIGEAAGALASFALSRQRLPREVRSRPALLQDFQRSLIAQGFELVWPSDVHAI
jgi:hypothetical protein